MQNFNACYKLKRKINRRRDYELKLSINQNVEQFLFERSIFCWGERRRNANSLVSSRFLGVKNRPVSCNTRHLIRRERARANCAFSLYEQRRRQQKFYSAARLQFDKTLNKRRSRVGDGGRRRSARTLC